MNLVRNLVISVLMTIVTTILLGVIYPLAITALAQAVFPSQANGQLIEHNGTVVGSRVIGQVFSGPGYFRSRPSATAVPYDAANSAGSQYGPTNKKLIDAVKANVDDARKDNPGAAVPVDLVTASASGLDPHISPAAAEFQVPRVARERHMPEDQLRRLVAGSTEGRQLGFLGEPRVNVLDLNLALDRMHPLAR
jgi:K+-transporting ATPase ATPase C chain